MNIKKEIIKYSKFFEEHGFKLNTSLLRFEKVFPHGKQVIYANITDGDNGKSIEYHLGIRINTVEELIIKQVPMVSFNPEQSITFSQSLNKLRDSSTKKIKSLLKMNDPTDIHSKKDFFLNEGFKWLDQMINPSRLQQEISKLKEDSFESHNLVEKAFKVTALSKLYNPNYYPILRQSFLEKINCNEMTPFTIASFLQFLNYLDNLKSEAA